MPEETVVLKVFATEIDAKMARDVLKDEGITASVFKSSATDTRSLLVNPVDADRARKILQPLFAI